MSKHYATWNISLTTECPECGYDFCLIKQNDDFWVDGGRYELCEHDTDNTRDVVVECPDCGHKFEVDFEY